jgi:hypothetical protein
LSAAGIRPGIDLLADKGFRGEAFAAAQAGRATTVLVPPGRKDAEGVPARVHDGSRLIEGVTK